MVKTSRDILENIDKQVPTDWRTKRKIKLEFTNKELEKIVEVLYADYMCELMCGE